MQFTQNGDYEVVTNGVQILPVRVAVGEAPPVLDSVAGVKITKETVLTAVDNIVSVPVGKGILYNLADSVGNFVMELNNLGTAHTVTGVLKYIIFDLNDDINYYINVAKGIYDQALVAIQNIKELASIVKYAFDFALMGIEFAAFLL